jgi:hypothetical protein
VSRLTDLIAQTRAKDPLLAADLDREFNTLSSRLPFGLNFERHRPEAVELPQRPIRNGDKVRILPLRGETTKGDQRLWQVREPDGFSNCVTGRKPVCMARCGKTAWQSGGPNGRRTRRGTTWSNSLLPG